MKWIDVISKGVLPLLSPGFILLFSFTANDNDLQMELLQPMTMIYRWKRACPSP